MTINRSQSQNSKSWDLWSLTALSQGDLYGVGGEEIDSINIYVYFQGPPYIELSYTYNKGEMVKYRVEFVSIASNLGIGEIWYFICPHSGKRCRKLYEASKYFRIHPTNCIFREMDEGGSLLVKKP